MQHCLKLCNKDGCLFKTQCSILATVMYVHPPESVLSNVWSLDDTMSITTECEMKMTPDDDHIIFCNNSVSRWHNNHYYWMQNEKWHLMMTISYIVPYIVITLHNNCYSWIHTEKWCIMHIHTCKTKKLPKMVSLIPK